MRIKRVVVRDGEVALAHHDVKRDLCAELQAEVLAHLVVHVGVQVLDARRHVTAVRVHTGRVPP